MAQAKEFLGRGWAFPVGIDPITGRFAMSEYGDDVKEAIRIIIETSPGERVMRPEFGCGVHDLVFESLNATTIGLIESSVFDALVTFEPRINVQSVNVDENVADDGKLITRIEYTLRDSNRRDNLVYAFYVRGTA